MCARADPKATAGKFHHSMYIALVKADLSLAVPHATRSAASAPTDLAAHAELAANGVVHCLPGELPDIRRRDEEQERKDRLVTMHTSANSEDV